MVVAHRTARIAGLNGASLSVSPRSASAPVPTERSVLAADGEVLGTAGAVMRKQREPAGRAPHLSVGARSTRIKLFYSLNVRLIGLTGGIGSGKSTVSARLAELGAVVIDADAVVRELQEPGQPVFAAMARRWGERIVNDDGTLNRAEVAGIVFSDPVELEALESIVHPVLQSEIKDRIAAQADSEAVVILDMALLAEKDNPYGVREIIVVDLSTAEQISRLVAFRGFTADDATKRIAAQASREDRLAIADHVVDNSGDLEALVTRVDQLWGTLSGDAAEPT